MYKIAGAYIPKMQSKFKDLVAFHNKMIKEKVKYIINELPKLEKPSEMRFLPANSFSEIANSNKWK